MGPAALQGLADAIQPAIKETLPNFIALNASSVLSGLSPASLAQQTATLILQSSLISLDNDTFIAELIVQAGLNLLSPQSPPLTRVLQTTDTLSAQPAANGNLAGYGTVRACVCGLSSPSPPLPVVGCAGVSHLRRMRGSSTRMSLAFGL